MGDDPAVRKAVIPAAGHGTRMHPVSKTVPKELLPIGSKPAVHWVVEEAAAAGLTEIAVVLSPAKRLLFEYLASSGLDRELGVRFEYVDQDVQRGLADAMWRCRDFCDGEPFALLLPDNVVLAPEYRLEGMIDVYRDTGLDVVGVLELDVSHSGLYGNCGRIRSGEARGRALPIHELSGKEPGRLVIEPGTTVRRTCGRYVCRPHVFEYMEPLRESTNGAPGELDEVPVYQAIIRDHGAMGWIVPPPLFDVGYPLGFAAANGYFAETLAPGR